MKIKTIENLVGISMDVTVDEIKKVQKYDAEALALRDEDGNQKFKVFLDECTLGMGNLTDFGATFKGIDTKPLIWVGLPTDKLNCKQDYVLETFGVALANLKVIEQQIKASLRAVEDKISTIKDSFVDLDAE